MAKGKLELQFPRNDTDEDEGLSDAGIETFKGVPYSSVARESGQNSRDAVSEFPVRMRFDVLTVAREDFPDFSAFSKTIEACSKRAADRNEKKEAQFFDKAGKLLKAETLCALKISDEGTTGLIGPCVAGKPFHSLVKASGVTNKNDPTAGGSYGIGKRAAFAVSDLHTVFYSTLYKDGEQTRYLAQGKCTLVSHERDGAKLRATGYWGKPSYLPIDAEAEAPEWLRRESIGTSAISFGFSADGDWKYKIAESLVRNFFTAIHRGELEFYIDNGAIELNKGSLHEVFGSKFVLKAAEDQGTEEELSFSTQLYECLIDPSSKKFNVAIPEIGSFVMHLLVRDDLPKRVAIVRNGMVITDNLQRFGDKFSHFPMYKEFVAVLEPSDQKGKTTIKRLENPEHNDLSADRLIDEAEQKAVRRGMNVLKKWVREQIKSEAFVAPKEEVSLDEMNEFFGDVSNADRIPTSAEGDTHPLVVTYKPIKSKLQPPTEGGQSDEGQDDGGGPDGQSAAGDNGTSDGDGRGEGAGGAGGEALTYEEFRNIRDPSNPATTRNLFFTPLHSGPARVRVVVKGMNNDVPMPASKVMDSQGVPISVVNLEAGKRTKLTVQFAEPYLGPISMLLNKGPGAAP